MPSSPVSSTLPTETVDSRGAGADAGPIAAGSRLGRYVILRALGTGGAGTVYEAFDPELGRGVAIKVLHFERHEQESGSGAHARLLREAQAMAKVRHPNVRVETRRDPARGERLVKEARAQFASPETPEPERAAAVDAWWAARR